MMSYYDDELLMLTSGISIAHKARLIDVMYDQIEKMTVSEQQSAVYALGLLNNAKTCENVGLGPMEGRSEYKAAYNHLRGMGLEVGGLKVPYESIEK